MSSKRTFTLDESNRFVIFYDPAENTSFLQTKDGWVELPEDTPEDVDTDTESEGETEIRIPFRLLKGDSQEV